MATAKMKIILPLVVWICLQSTTVQSYGGIGFGIKHERFLLNLEDGYFGCQMNTSTDVMQLFELSRLCDGVPDCFLGSDELRDELKCTNDCRKDDGTECQNGACLDNNCHCNDGFGGCSCEVPDENECKYRPCSPFAQCTNTLGSFFCTCYSGYTGDGLHCEDINECDDPAIAARCVQNAECCNLPAHFLCKCKPGFQGDGESRCIDIDECALPNTCGHGALCQNTPGNYSCVCPEGFHGNPYDGCVDLNECDSPNACGPGALCTNLPGGKSCTCPPGYEGNAFTTGCYDSDECARSPCGRDALCSNAEGSFRCACPPGFIGDPTVSCTEVACHAHEQCQADQACINGRCENPCAASNPCGHQQDCQIQNHQPVCVKVCQCQRHQDCGSYGLICDGCNCVQHEEPVITSGCEHCPPGVPCDPTTGACIKVGCTSNEHCPITEACVNGACKRPCDLHDPCAQNAICINTNHGTDCSCAEGYQGNGYVGCTPVIDYKPICQYNEDCPPNKLCDRLNRLCINPCFEDSCGDNAECIPKNHGIDCQCLPGHVGNPYVFCSLVQGCHSDSECPTNLACINTQCASPCKCGSNAICDVINHKPQCKCPEGYAGNPLTGCSPPSNPCDPNPCGLNAFCELDNGNPICFCPKGLTGNPFKNCIPEGDECTPNPCGPNSGCRLVGGQAVCFCLPEYEGTPPTVPCALPDNPCNPSPCGPNTQCTILSNGFAKCTCLHGYLESPNTIRGCVEQRNPCEPNPCGHGAQCDPHREPVCFCPYGLIGNPYRSCAEPVQAPVLCQPGPCGANADCYVSNNEEQCYCKNGFIGDAYVGCTLQPTNPCIPNPCSPGAICVLSENNQPVCQCPIGMGGDPTGAAGCHGFECLVDSDCSQSAACIGHRCRDPCPGSCGVNADCRVEQHHPVCTCHHGLTGNPIVRCYALPAPMPVNDPCMPNPCGLNTICQVLNGRAVCSCLPDFLGDPQFGCKPECTLNSDCPEDKSCLNRHCVNPCKIGAICGVNAVCQVQYHTATCLCPEGFTGDAFIQCIPKPIVVYPVSNVSRPCYPSPCEQHYACDNYGGHVAICDPCLGPNAIYHPQCRPECLTNADCPFNRACLGEVCADPCIGSCGVGATCMVVAHTPVCSCPYGLHGNPFEHCSVPPPDDHGTSCENIQCGSNADCKQHYNDLTCVCKPGFFGNPWFACRPECVINSDCGMTKACINNKCVDPCAGACGLNSQCECINHIPICFCPVEHTGDPFVSCYPFKQPPPPIENLPLPINPCDPSPCGPFSRCLVSPQGFSVCSCLPSYRGTPPACKPECVVSSECPQNKACMNQKCVDPCPGTCGLNARCAVINHNPICTCPAGQDGDPFVRCYEPVVIEEPKTPGNPCVPSPCGPNSICQVKERRPVCSCVANYIGNPPHCRPECTISSECPQTKACIREKCVDPCIGKCGHNAKCFVINHTPGCTCDAGYEGDAFIGCSAIIIQEPIDPCNPSPCGDNSQCSIHNGAARCTCIPPYIGNPYAGGCRPECTINSDCPSHLACLAQHCRDPCQGLCGINAECSIVNHVPVCSCARGLIGDPFTSCRRDIERPPTNPCEPSPCGPNSLCRINKGHAVCSCRPNYNGAPPNCRPECLVSSECNLNQACINQKCKDPCPGTCGISARCQVINHNPICSCPAHYVGDPFVQCVKEVKVPEPPVSPCVPSPCGPNAECRVIDARPVCSCLLGMFGAPPNCRPECAINQDCPSHLACINQKCKDPCAGSCGFNAQCSVQNHRPLCACLPEYEGDPFVGCNLLPVIQPVEEPRHPCNPSPCGANAACNERNGAGSCVCLPDYFGDPYSACRPECVMNSDCSFDRTCINNKCKDPCIGTCGLNAECRVAHHNPVCTCLPGYTGNPSTSCQLIPPPPLIVHEPTDPCLPSPCGPYSVCRNINGHAVCSCQRNYIGTPPGCRPECTISADCNQDRACIKNKCQDPCPGTCGLNARCQVVNHNAICSCAPGFTGDPFIRCLQEQKTPVVIPAGNPCVPSPCGPNSQCRVINDQGVCSCLENFIGRPPNCRPECTINAECPGNLACLHEKCRDPCPGSCGVNTNCVVVRHAPLCTCHSGYTGDPFVGCSPIPIQPVEEVRNPCNPSPCGANAVCKERNGAGSCTCLPEYFGDPYTACQPECVINADCPHNKACVNMKCTDPCPGTCGINAECRVNNHAPNCFCFAGYSGNPAVACHLPPPVIHEEPKSDPCVPSPCGPYSTCRVLNGHAVCSCQPNYIGSPPMCRPECMISADCSLQKACVNTKCVDPCPGTCGLNARCHVVNHNPICSCPADFVGDPFVRCLQQEKRPVIEPTRNPCLPSPCGPNSICRAIGNTPACSCKTGYVGRPPSCRPECTISVECPSNLACINEKCQDPCPGSCGSNAECQVINHRSVCMCIIGYTGDPFAGCSIIPVVQPVEIPSDPCNPSPCGANAICKERNGVGSCICIDQYSGDPYTSCRPECVTNSDCARHLACLNNKCRDPCPGICGLNAECHVSNHAPVCNCLPGYIGNPLSSCHLPPPVIHDEPKSDPCVPSQCGPYSQCRVVDGHAVCSCLSNYIGTPPSCRPECVVSTECSQNKACLNNKCQDPCPGTCGLNARCQVINHNPICSCPAGYIGDPFVRCNQEEKRPVVVPSGNPCIPSPCGPNSQCRVVGEHAACSCLPNYIGRSPNCRPECTINAECAGNLACQNEKCVDPCPGSCGAFTSCRVIKHAPVCMCEDGYTGDPFSGCRPIPLTPLPVETPRDPCNPTPCGANAQCREHNGAGSCVCLPEYFGDPYTGCRPECVTNSDCDRSKACVNQKCKDPCPGTCGINAECHVFNHAPSCSCIQGYTGNPSTSCSLIVVLAEEPRNPCVPSPCGPYSICREVNGHAVCSCNAGYIGAPPMCKPECVVSSECPQNKACSNQKCVDPCPGTCGHNAKCQVINHNPICSCPIGYSGDAFVSCSLIELPPPKAVVNPCDPSPCGPNSQCRVIGDQAACSCLPNYIGRAPNCRPECTSDSECANNLACRNEKCKNPCSGYCGQNAICTVVNHKSVCSCLPGFVGNALVACQLPPPPPSSERTPPATPCSPSPCGPNAECREQNGAGACICPPNYLGDPYDKTRGCHRECETSNDCSPQLACVAFKCVDPCPGTCGILAECHVNSHVPTCVCLPGFTGDPFFQCREIPVEVVTRRPEDPCNPSPCGLNSQCRNVDGHSVCSCLPNFIGAPPNCKPECVVSSECPLDKACLQQKCSDPCPNTCGIGAQCYAKNHNPICACPPGYTGDPFTRCSPQPVEAEPPATERPPSCQPSPCGPNSKCQIRNGVPSCSCLPSYVGAPPNCRPECVINSECSSQLACINLKCRDPCPGSCGASAKCHVLNHVPICTCEEGYTGDPFTQCRPKPPAPTPRPEDPCDPSPCGPNAQCNNGVCTCLPEYLGNPYEACRPECVLNNECSRDKACLRNKCKDPCPGTCGQNARCDVINHIPTCSCQDGYTGDPFTHCRVQEPPAPEPKRDPCHPSPCGPNSQCRNVNDHAVCSCVQGFFGTPPNCKPECIVSSECPLTKACVNQKCTDPCLGSCGIGARCEVINHSPICSCPERQTGDPFQSCRELPRAPEPDDDYRDPCLPSPCGPNSVCRNVGESPSCSCVAGYVGNPPNCRPECVINPDCPSNQACINNKCIDPCPGSCGQNAECRVISHTVSCYCSPGFTGNPFVQCIVQKEDIPKPCEPSPCGANAVCKERNGAGSCICLPDYQGNPYEGCRPECVLSSDCPTNRACIRNKCQDPCPGVCGTNAECSVINHVPTCTCVFGYIGNPFTSCTPEPQPPVDDVPVVDPCNPSPCGPNSQCRNINDHAVCSCQPEYFGTPPNCKPECVVSSECPQDKACHKFKCANPCRGTCGVGARCEVINHNPICSCPHGLTGDPFTRCYEPPPPPRTPEPEPPRDPCLPSPCGANSICRANGDQASCSCLANYVGSPPNCRPECVVNTDCPSNLACITEKCRDPCPGSCGFNADCRIQNHIPNCICIQDYIGDPFVQCNPRPPAPIVHDDPCNPSPCGNNAQCNNGLCTCLPEYHGDPYRGCRPECTMNADCSPNKSCSNNKCIDPCPGTCGQGARCDVVNHIPTCSCPAGFEGDPFTSCRPIVIVEHKQPCNPSPCGPNSICNVINSVAVCACQTGYIGSPPACRPECVVSAECTLTQACLNNKCIDPCPGTCGISAKCQVINHNPICSCTSGNTGDPFSRCYPIIVQDTPKVPENPCVPSPCGANSVCQVRGESPACSCLPNFIGAPPNCRPECTINPECSSSLACIRQKCSDPCPGSCGSNAVCKVINHNPVCTCIPGYNGDPFTGCSIIPATPPPLPDKPDPCIPSPCGSNARCRVEYDQAVCECLPEYRGNPYEACRPECVANTDCPMNRACIRNKCQDPCPGTCGINAQCDVINHIPMCTCLPGYTGDAFRLCNFIQPRDEPVVDPCNPSPCGINTICRTSGKNAICECLPGFFGTPNAGGCRPECTISADCPRNRACSNMKCIDPCPGVCGFNAVCQVINHSPVCSCPAPMIGDPFTHCREPQAEPVDPCNPSPCRANGQCRVQNGAATCVYPECVINQDCPRTKACYNQKCRDPCRDACGLNALCQPINHNAVCSCPPGYEGVPEIQCRVQRVEIPKPECIHDSECTLDKACINQQCRNPCLDNICGANAECRVQTHRPICFCRDGFAGNAHSACVEIGCRSDSECPAIQSCVNRECVDPCLYTQCGINAFCRADSNHRARCYCPDRFRGDPQVRCERPECTVDEECPYNLACRNERCEDPCNCGFAAICHVTNHRPQCSCPPGYIGNPQISCNIAPVVVEPQCKMDADCTSKLACFSGVCKNPCVETRPCGVNAECSVVDTLPLRTMSCLCLPGYVGDADKECRLAPHDEPGCKSSDDCSLSETCLNRQCVNPCAVANPCALTAKCSPTNHKALCRCPPGLVGDPFIKCSQVPQNKPECTTSSECANDRACINQRCQDPCALANPCGNNANCRTNQHHPTCKCPDGWGGNPQVLCYKPECKSDNECPYDKACINENCLNPCLTTSCGRGGECVVQAHRAKCQCPFGTQGNPLVSCIAGVCQYNEDCADHEACDRLNRVCRPVCDDVTCAVTATCVGRNHQPKCQCPIGTNGNPYQECLAPRQPEPECKTDSDCPSQLACINAHCQNPCAINNVCSIDQECRVLDSLPLRTVMCQCPPDTFIDNNGRCRTIMYDQAQCHLDNDCSDREKCVRGSCRDACSVDFCGVNAQCNSRYHQALCTCAPGYTGNPHVECSNIPKSPTVIPVPECISDADCTYDKTCRNDRCVNPCLYDKPCAIGAFCSINHHQAICNCPSGYEGNPKIECIPPVEPTVGCKSNSECARSEACVNARCVSPCNCGPHAECRVTNHYPICYCRPGYSGNPQIGCVKLGCQSDNECASDKQCYNGQCINPCILGDPCAASAECYGNNHRATCRCPSGYIGNPFQRCERVECHVDAECPLNRACIQQRCVDPCSSIANPPCAQNAICYAQNHAAGCMCPPHLSEGNPLSYCTAPVLIAGKAECQLDVDCPSKLACIKNSCVNPCHELSPCHRTAQCSVLDTVPVRTMICTCPEGWVPNDDGECHAVIVPSPPGCTSDDECPTTEACINRMCRNPCDCGTNSACFVQNHRPICSCEEGHEGNPNIACRAVGCRIDSECESGKACINGNCINPCLIRDPCGINAECYVFRNRAECRCLSGYRGNPLDRCMVVGCTSNSDCPGDRQCINAQCINPCVYDNPCSPRAECRVQNHMALCRCPVGYIGNPYVDCRREPQPECREDPECPSRLACIKNRCQDPCAILEPCHTPSQCEVVPSVPVRTMICICPPGYISSGSGTCVPTIPVKEVGGCVTDPDCPANRACVQGICKDPCNCGPNAECRIKNHKPVCTCRQGYDGNPEIECSKVGCRSDSECHGTHSCINRQCVAVCDATSCGLQANCLGINHRAICECLPGYQGNPKTACILIGCRADSECPLDRACVNQKCASPCDANPCLSPSICRVFDHKAVCACPSGYNGDGKGGCVKEEVKCRSDADCPSQTACINNECVNPCNATEPCGVNADCRILDTTPVRTMICECLPGYQGNAAVQCDKMALCRTDKGYITTPDGNCVCPPNTALNENDECVLCPIEKGLKVDDRGRCVCALERGLNIDERGNCVCPTEFGYRLDSRGNCVPVIGPECENDEHCPDHRFCNPQTKTCDDPCSIKNCGINALCNATNHQAVCQCITGYTGDPEVLCNRTSPFRTDFPRPEMVVSCLSDGVQVEIHITEPGFNGVLYVKGHSKDEQCRRVVTLPSDTLNRIEYFKVQFGNCGLIHVNGQASFVLVIQKHPKLVTYKAQAYHIKCVYQTGEHNVTLGFNVSMLTTAGTIANTGPPPTCLMKIVTPTGQEINSAEIGDNLMLQVDVQPGSIYGGFARSCVAKTMEDNIENEYLVTDENGCATDPTIFGEWEYNSDTQSLLASFNAFKFPSSDNIRFQCNIRVCFGKCQPVNCRGYNAFGRRKRDVDDENNTDLANSGDLINGQLREEITIQSNAILTFERREERFTDPQEAPDAQRVEDICVSMIGFIIALIITALLALVAVAVAVSCWLMAYRRRPKASGPLPHPPEFPNPLFTTPEPMTEPSPDYLT